MASPFAAGQTVSLAATTSTGSVAIGGGSGPQKTVRLWNAGAVTIFVKVGTSAVAAAVTDLPIPAGAPSEVLKVGPGDTHIAGITASGTGTLYATPGEGGV